jgi:hypothetical protein
MRKNERGFLFWTLVYTDLSLFKNSIRRLSRLHRFNLRNLLNLWMIRTYADQRGPFFVSLCQRKSALLIM